MRGLVDAHVHLYPERRLRSLMRWVRRGIPGHPVPVDITVDGAVADLRRAGIEKFFAAVFPLGPGESRELNRFNADLARRIPEMIPLGTVHQDDEVPGAVAGEALRVLGLKGIKLHPMMMRMAPGDPRLRPAYALAQEMGLPVLAHTGFEEGYGTVPDKEGWEALFASFPRLTFILAHAFFPDLPYAFSLLPRFDNVVLDLTNVPGMLFWPDGPLPFGVSRSRWGREDLAAAIESNAARVLFGSDHPAGMGAIEDVVRQFEDLGMGAETAERVLRGNALELIARHRMA